MATSQALLAQLELLLGKAYTAIKGDAPSLAPYTASACLAKAKTLIRGGHSDTTGFVKFNEFYTSDSSGVVLPIQVTGVWTTDVAVATSAIYFQGMRRDVPMATISLTDKGYGGQDLIDENDAFYAVVAAEDTSHNSVATVSYTVYPGPVTRLADPPTPTIPDTSVPVAKIKVTTSGVATADISYEIQKKAYFLPDGDDSVVNRIFTPIAVLSNAYSAETHFDEFRDTISGFQSDILNTYGITFKEYWKSRHQFSNDFRQLYYDVTADDLSVELGGVTRTTLTVNNECLLTPDQLEITAATTNNNAQGVIQVWGLSPTYTANPLIEQVKATDTTIKVGTVAQAWPTTGSLTIRDTSSGSLVSYFGAYSYSRDSVATCCVFTITPAAPTGIKNWSNVYYTEAEIGNVASNSFPGCAFPVGTRGSSYLGIAAATMLSAANTPDLAVTIRSK